MRLIDADKLIDEIKNCLWDWDYVDGITATTVLKQTITDIENQPTVLLKEQEAITIKKTKEHGFGVYGGICPKCRNWIQSAHSYCGSCGQAVKWE
jgi:hypothetical protein